MPLPRAHIPVLLLILFFPVLSTATAEQDVIIGFHDSIGQPERKLVTGNGGIIRHELELIDALAVTIPATAISGLRTHPSIKYIEQDEQLSASPPLPSPESMAATVEELQQSWSIQHIAADTAHNQGITGAEVKVAVIDTGIDYNHPDLKENYRGGYDFVNEDNDPMDDSFLSHGTQVAGIIAAKRNGQGVVGVAPDASLYALKVMDSEGASSISMIIAALQWAVDNGIDIVNISMGGPHSTAFEDACNSAYEAGVLIIAAAGNTERKAVHYPAAYSSVIAVGATSQQDQAESYTAQGEEVELAAPGTAIHSTKKEGGYGTASGTSQAAPHIAGVAALILSAGVEDLNNDGLRNNKDVRLKLLMATRDLGEPGRDSLTGYGVIDVNSIDNPRLIALPDLSLTMQADRSSFIRSERFNYTLQVHNNGEADALDTKLLLTLPAGMKIYGDTCTPRDDSDNSTNAEQPFTCPLGKVTKNGGFQAVDITVSLPENSSINIFTSKATVTTPLEKDTSNNTAEETINLTNRPPVAGEIQVDTLINTPVTTRNVLDSARDEDGDTLTIINADTTSQAGGTVANHGDGTFTYTPSEDFVGSDSFNYVISDNRGGSVTGTINLNVQITLTATLEHTPDPAVPGDKIIHILTLRNNSAIEVEQIEVLMLFQSNKETIFLTTDKRCQNNKDSILTCNVNKIEKNGGITQLQVATRALAATTTNLLVSISDANNFINDTGLSKMIVIETNNNPIARDDQATTGENSPLTITTALNNDSDPDGDQIHIKDTDKTSREGGNVHLSDGNTITYTPPEDFTGEDNFQYTIDDGNGGSATATITITVNKKTDSDPLPPEEPEPKPDSSPWAGASSPLLLLLLLVVYPLRRSLQATITQRAMPANSLSRQDFPQKKQNRDTLQIE